MRKCFAREEKLGSREYSKELKDFPKMLKNLHFLSPKNAKTKKWGKLKKKDDPERLKKVFFKGKISSS